MTDLLIRDLSIKDKLNNTEYVKAYEIYLNDKCKIHLKFFTDEKTNQMKYHDLTGSEKIRLFNNITIPELFLLLEKKDEIQNYGQGFTP